MQWIAENWLILILVGGMIVMHLFGHGHGGHGKKKKDKPTDQENAARNPDDDDA